MAYEVLGRRAQAEAPDNSKGDTGDKGEKGIQGLRGDNESPRSIEVGPGFDTGAGTSTPTAADITAADINVSPYNGYDYVGNNERNAGWMSTLSSGAIQIDVSSASGRYKSDSLGVTIDKIAWYRYYIVGPGKISDIRLEKGEDGNAVFACQWDGLKGDVPFLTYDALVIFEYIADDGDTLTLLED